MAVGVTGWQTESKHRIRADFHFILGGCSLLGLVQILLGTTMEKSESFIRVEFFPRMMDAGVRLCRCPSLPPFLMISLGSVRIPSSLWAGNEGTPKPWLSIKTVASVQKAEGSQA